MYFLIFSLNFVVIYVNIIKLINLFFPFTLFLKVYDGIKNKNKITLY